MLHERSNGGASVGALRPHECLKRPTFNLRHIRESESSSGTVVCMDAIRVNIRSGGAVSSKAVFVALAILPDGTRDVLRLWFQGNRLCGCRPFCKKFPT
ncbi:MAG: transposase [Marinovum algicola]|uniref:transposase n=1 Tax=Roseovarius sp. TaxID=1486281 RepID=UPI0032EB15FE